jgi:ribosomal protein L11
VRPTLAHLAGAAAARTLSERSSRAAGISSGSQKPGHQIRSTMSLKHVYEIAKARRGGFVT